MNTFEDRQGSRELTETTIPQPEEIVVEATSIEEAKNRAAELWNISSSDIDTEVLEDTKRLFGLLGKKLKVRVVSKMPLMYLQARDFATSLMRQTELDLQTTLGSDFTLNLDGDDSAIVIGRHGETLKALEFVTNLIYRTDQQLPKIRFDCGGYRVRREESLMRLADSVAKEVLQKNAPVSLEPMSSWERRVIHMALQDNKAITTTSDGEEPMRRITVRPSDQKPDRRRHYRKRKY